MIPGLSGGFWPSPCYSSDRSWLWTSWGPCTTCRGSKSTPHAFSSLGPPVGESHFLPLGVISNHPNTYTLAGFEKIKTKVLLFCGYFSHNAIFENPNNLILFLKSFMPLWGDVGKLPLQKECLTMSHDYSWCNGMEMEHSYFTKLTWIYLPWLWIYLSGLKKKVWDKVKRHGLLAFSFTNHKSFIIEKRSMSCSLCIPEIPLIIDSTTSSSLIYW